MKIDRLMNDTFAAHEHLAPDSDTVMAAVQQRISHRSPAAGWAVATASAAAVVAVVAGSVLVASQSRGHQVAPSTGTIAAATTANKPKVAAPAPVKAIPSLTMPFDLGWLPQGSADAYAHRINIGGTSMTSPPSLDGEYMVTVTTATTAIDVDVQQMPGSDLAGMRFKSGPGQAITINGRAGVECTNASGPGGYEIYFLDSDGTLMYVNTATHPGKTGSPAQLTAIGRQIARTVRLPGTTQVTPTFGLGYLPAGLRMTAFDVEKVDPRYGLGNFGLQTAYSIGTPTTQDAASTVNVATNIAIRPAGTPGRQVQGHPTRYQVDHGYTSLYVLNAVAGKPVLIAAKLSLAELYKIGDGLILPS